MAGDNDAFIHVVFHLILLRVLHRRRARYGVKAHRKQGKTRK